MPTPPTAAREAFGDIAPKLAGLTDEVLFGDVWVRPGLSPRDRSVTRAELEETITHVAFSSRWPTAMSALTIARRVFAERDAT